jgi:hypothetical protein
LAALVDLPGSGGPANRATANSQIPAQVANRIMELVMAGTCYFKLRPGVTDPVFSPQRHEDTKKGPKV